MVSLKVLYDLALGLSAQRIPYIYGGKNPMVALDCSGYVSVLLNAVGIKPPGDNNAQALYDYFQQDGTPNVYKLGSLVFYGDSVTKIDHVAILLDEATITECAGGDHTTLSLIDATAKRACTRIRNVDYRKDKVAVIRPRAFMML